jgi:hypothetical protein
MRNIFISKLRNDFEIIPKSEIAPFDTVIMLVEDE